MKTHKLFSSIFLHKSRLHFRTVSVPVLGIALFKSQEILTSSPPPILIPPKNGSYNRHTLTHERLQRPEHRADDLLHLTLRLVQPPPTPHESIFCVVTSKFVLLLRKTKKCLPPSLALIMTETQQGSENKTADLSL